MGNPNCCLMIIAVAFFSPANRRGELWYTNIRELDVIKEDLDLTRSEDTFQFCIFEKFVLSFQSCSVRTILEKKEQKWKG